MNCEKEILKVLAEAGQNGLSIQKISYHVFNASNSFFDTISIDEIHQLVAAYLKKNSRGSDSFVEKTGKRGVYRLNPQNGTSAQLMFTFDEEDTLDVNEKRTEDQSLSLF